MNFKEIEEQYNYSLDVLKTRKKRGVYTDKQVSAITTELRSFFRNLRYACDDSYVMRFLEEHEKELYIDCGNKASFIFEYRDRTFPVFTDDAGQQLYLVYNEDISISGGAFNTEPEFVFADSLDTLIDLEILGQ